MQLSNKELGQYLEEIRKSKGYSTYDVNKLTDISQSYISLIEKGKRKASAIILKTLAPIYSLDYLDLYEKAGYIDLIEDEKKSKILTALSSISKIDIPLLGTVKAGYDYLAEENIIGTESIDNVSDKENYYALQVTGDSMEPLFSDGDIAIVHRQDDFESGNTCIVLINGDEATVKKVVKVEGGIDLIAMNPYYPKKHFSNEEMKDIPVKVIGKVVEARKRNQFK